MNDKDLAEFIIDLATKNKTLSKFKSALLENGAEFSDSFIENLLRIIQHMRPGQGQPGPDGKSEAPRQKLSLLREQLPCLAIPDDQKERPPPAEKTEPEEDTDVDNMMSFLESMAPSRNKDDDRKRNRSRSRSRSRSRERRRRSRSRDRDR